MLTRDDVNTLKRPFAPEDHEAREGGKTRDGSKRMWLFYVAEEAVIDRLNEIDPAWSLEITRVERDGGYIATYGTLTVCGVSRSGVGTNSPNRDGDPLGENEEKGAATDLLKRLARLFGVGLYLKKSPNVYLPADEKPWEARDKAIAKLRPWLAQLARGKTTPPPPQAEPLDWAKFDAYLTSLGVTRVDVLSHAGGERLEDIAAAPDGKRRLMGLAHEAAEAVAEQIQADKAHAPPAAQGELMTAPQEFTG